jgi:hypothetical protein
MLSGHLAKQWKEALHPAVDGALIDQEAALGQPFTDFGVTEAVAHVPADRNGDDVIREGATRERQTRAPGVGGHEILALAHFRYCWQMQLELRTEGEEAGESRMLGRGFGRARQPLTQA